MSLELFEFDTKIKSSKTLFHDGFDYLTGTDEAGRGPCAGRVYAACVCFLDYKNIKKELFEVNDSKKLSEKKREELYPLIIENSIHSICYSTVDEIEKINILKASLDAMRRAVSEVILKLNSNNVMLLVDGNKLVPDIDIFQQTLIKGDTKSACIAASAILAKVERDRYMLEMDKKYPEYDFCSNKGYLTKKHLSAIKKYGICPIHRKSFLKNIL